jgi:hypothetical protein
VRLKNSQSVGLKLPKCRETHALIPLFIGVPAKVIEHITDDAYNRQGEFRRKKAENLPEREEKAKQHQPTGGRLEYDFFMACTQISTQTIWGLNFYSYICGVNQIYKCYADNYNA